MLVTFQVQILPAPLNRRALLIPFLLLALTAAACRGKHSRTVVQNEEAEGGPRIASSLKMGDPSATAQLLRGFHSLEGDGAWRWTAGTFAVLLRPPLGAAQHGATLSFSFSAPELVIQKLQSVTLTASIAGRKLKSETYTKSGSARYSAEIPGDQLTGESVTVEFALDRFLPAGSVDKRELGVVATAVGLESK
jgi:hypothetical protein